MQCANEDRRTKVLVSFSVRKAEGCGLMQGHVQLRAMRSQYPTSLSSTIKELKRLHNLDPKLPIDIQNP